MPHRPLSIDPDIRRAETLPGFAYGDADIHSAVRERVFARAWHLVADTSAVKVPGQVHPTLLCDGIIDEPIVLTRDRADRLPIACWPRRSPAERSEAAQRAPWASCAARRIASSSACS